MHDILAKMCGLQDNWDGDGARAVPFPAIERAAALLRTIPDSDQPPFIAPTVFGSVQLAWEDYGKTMIMHILNLMSGHGKPQC